MIPEVLLATGPSDGPVWRIVESQEQAATRSITHSADEQSRLELLLDDNKPAYMPGTENLHWLLKTPFRYPPLRHGSRFGSTTQPGMLYASRELTTAMTESAVYLWLFRATSLVIIGGAEKEVGRTAIQFDLAHARCSDLTAAAACDYKTQISDPASYVFSRSLGVALRASGAGAIWFHSARARGGVNCALIDPAAIARNTQPHQEHWQVQLDASACWWGRPGRDSFEIAYRNVSNSSGRIPHPAL